MASLLVLMPVFPSTTVSEALNLPDKLVAALASSTPFDASHAAPKPWAVRTRNSLRFIGSSVTKEGLLHLDASTSGRVGKLCRQVYAWPLIAALLPLHSFPVHYP